MRIALGLFCSPMFGLPPPDVAGPTYQGAVRHMVRETITLSACRGQYSVAIPVGTRFDPYQVVDLTPTFTMQAS